MHNSRAGEDLGLKDLATFSGGAQFETPSAHRASKSWRMAATDAKVKAGSKIAEPFGLIIIGNVNPSQRPRTKPAKKSVLDEVKSNAARNPTRGNFLSQMCTICRRWRTLAVKRPVASTASLVNRDL
jgi:hypothetical protein